MIEWLKKIAGVSYNYNNAEREEFIQLKKEYKMYKKKYANADKEDGVNSHSEEENDADEEQDNVDFEIQERKNKTLAKGQRASVSAEVYGAFNEKKAFVAKVIPKGHEQKQKIYDKVIQSFLFNSLEERDLNTVIDAMEEFNFKAGDQVIKQGEPGDVLYVVYSGTLACTKTFNLEDGDQFLKNYVPGEAFGELALLYNAPRAASIKASTDSVLYALDRETFNNIVKDAAM